MALSYGAPHPWRFALRLDRALESGRNGWIHPLVFLRGGHKVTLAKNPKNVKMYFDHENYVFVFKMHQILHAPSYDHFQGFPPTPGLQGFKKTCVFNDFSFCIFLTFLNFPPFWGSFSRGSGGDAPMGWSPQSQCRIYFVFYKTKISLCSDNRVSENSQRAKSNTSGTTQHNNNNNKRCAGAPRGSEKTIPAISHDTLRGRRKGDPQHKCCGNNPLKKI